MNTHGRRTTTRFLPKRLLEGSKTCPSDSIPSRLFPPRPWATVHGGCRRPPRRPPAEMDGRRTAGVSCHREPFLRPLLSRQPWGGPNQTRQRGAPRASPVRVTGPSQAVRVALSASLVLAGRVRLRADDTQPEVGSLVLDGLGPVFEVLAAAQSCWTSLVGGSFLPFAASAVG